MRWNGHSRRLPLIPFPLHCALYSRQHRAAPPPLRLRSDTHTTPPVVPHYTCRSRPPATATRTYDHGRIVGVPRMHTTPPRDMPLPAAALCITVFLRAPGSCPTPATPACLRAHSVTHYRQTDSPTGRTVVYHVLPTNTTFPSSWAF